MLPLPHTLLSHSTNFNLLFFYWATLVALFYPFQTLSAQGQSNSSQVEWPPSYVEWITESAPATAAVSTTIQKALGSCCAEAEGDSPYQQHKQWNVKLLYSLSALTISGTLYNSPATSPTPHLLTRAAQGRIRARYLLLLFRNTLDEVCRVLSTGHALGVADCNIRMDRIHASYLDGDNPWLGSDTHTVSPSSEAVTTCKGCERPRRDRGVRLLDNN